MRFPIPCVWREPSNHPTDCYFCMVGPSKRRKGKNTLSIKYADIPSSTGSVPHNTTGVPVPQPHLRDESFMTDATRTDSETEQSAAVCVRCHVAGEKCSCLLNQEDINDLVGSFHRQSRMLSFEFPAMGLIYWMTVFKLAHRESDVAASRCSPRLKDGLCYCRVIEGLFQATGISCNPSEWRLFIDSSSRSLKAVLLCNTNKGFSIPLAHLVHTKGEYQNVKILLCALWYDYYIWEVIGDLKMVVFLVGIQRGFTKFQCYPCLLDSRNTALHYKKRNWPPRTSCGKETHNVKRQPLIDAAKMLMPPLNIKLGLIKQCL